MKVLITGSRDWTNRHAIEREMNKLPPGTIIIHGGCPTGADRMADEIARLRRFTVRVYPADWEGELARTGSAGAAGPKRNTFMVQQEHHAGEPIDLCLAFALDLQRSKGTKDCASKAKKAGISVVPIAS